MPFPACRKGHICRQDRGFLRRQVWRRVHRIRWGRSDTFDFGLASTTVGLSNRLFLFAPPLKVRCRFFFRDIQHGRFCTWQECSWKPVFYFGILKWNYRYCKYFRSVAILHFQKLDFPLCQFLHRWSCASLLQRAPAPWRGTKGVVWVVKCADFIVSILAFVQMDYVDPLFSNYVYLDLPDLENFQGLQLNPRFVPQNQGFRKKPRFFQKPGFFQKSFSRQSEWDVFFQFY